MKYDIPVESGQYELTLWFAETNNGFQAKGKRTIKIVANGEELVQKLDVFAEAGANMAWAFRRDISVEGKSLLIELLADPVGPAVKGIEVRRVEQSAKQSASR